jgi:hypothetical protein
MGQWTGRDEADNLEKLRGGGEAARLRSGGWTLPHHQLAMSN